MKRLCLILFLVLAGFAFAADPNEPAEPNYPYTIWSSYPLGYTLYFTPQGVWYTNTTELWTTFISKDEWIRSHEETFITYRQIFWVMAREWRARFNMIDFEVFARNYVPEPNGLTYIREV